VTTYRASGVDLEAADELVALVGPHVTATWNDRVVGGFGGFAAGIRLPSGYRTPVLMMSTDGVGTKADIAAKTSILGGLGWDLLAMVADDLAAAGAAPFAVQDYIATGRLAPSRIAMLVESLAAACAENGVALLGGETAEHPGVLGPDEFDLAATALGIVEEGDVVDGSAIEPGDVLLGVESPNLRSNGFSLVRNVITDRLDLDAPFPGDDRPTAEVLLEPSVVYAPAVNDVLAAADVHGLVHVTGGGLPGNVARVLPPGCRAAIERSRWEVPNVFAVVQQLGGVTAEEMFRVFNMGIGFVVVAPESAIDGIIGTLQMRNHLAAPIGRIVAGDRGVDVA
jgi:phosphoribosylformylglycinamidine cyclo-ligase